MKTRKRLSSFLNYWSTQIHSMSKDIRREHAEVENQTFPEMSWKVFLPDVQFSHPFWCAKEKHF